MAVTRERPPAHVCAAFGADPDSAEPLPESTAWRLDDIVLRPVSDRVHAVWLARTFAAIEVSDVRVARPLRTTDGRWVIAGWSAARYVPGSREHRHDDIVHTAVKLHQATFHLPRPEHLLVRDDIPGTAERVAWGEQDIPLDEKKGGRWFEILAPSRRPIDLPDQLVHGELFGNVLFDGDDTPPGVVDFAPYYRPAEWGAAIAAVDAIAWGGADGELLRRWSHLPEWSQLLLRAILFRLACNALDPRSTASALDGLRVAASEVSEFV
ncbi:TIGR02569 family protein [Saccharomonospora sp. NPDC006951]